MSEGERKSIVLFSDGTGNSSAKLFKTNVWRMYEAVDLGPAAPGKRSQIAYYDDGVGTSSFKPFALLGGAFGWGLKRNVLDIYRYACRNYRDGDCIYGFGFSRGAFTMRVAIALIAEEGLVPSDNEGELVRRSVQAYRRFRRHFNPRKVQWPTKAGRWLRDSLTGWWDARLGVTPYTGANNREPIIRFVGVWDTVAAYGGPIVEITRAIDNWVYPLSMPDYELNEKVQCARHALALDDERDSFQPLLWDEVHERALKLPEDRLQQVWFTGMHADVGGGYPDESLSYVSLLWMMEEAKKADLRTLDTIKDRFIALANSAGPIHDSRRGVAAYYRYQPRKIAAWLNPVDARTLSLRDPIIKASDGKAKGLLLKVNVHESVIARIAKGTDRYAPITLPQEFTIVPPQSEGENAPQPSSDDRGAPERPAVPRSIVGQPLTDRLNEEAPGKVRAQALEAVWDYVWRRRVAYFVTVGLTLLLALMPLWASHVWPPLVLSDGRTWLGSIIRLGAAFVPGFLAPWIDTYANNSVYFLTLAGLVALVMSYSARCELTLRDRARHVWREAITIGQPPSPAAPPTGLERFRNSPRYQRGVQVLKWNVLPNLVLTPLAVIAAAWLLSGVYVQSSLPFLEGGTALCAPIGGHLPKLDTFRFEFRPEKTCVTTGVTVEAGSTYVVTFDVRDMWKDGRAEASPLGLAASDLGVFGLLGSIFRRIVDAGYLQPAIEIRPEARRFAFDNVYIYPLTAVQNDITHYRAEFTAQRSGELLMFANDSVNPFDVRYFYERSGRGTPEELGNHGSACVTIRRADVAPGGDDGNPVPACPPSAANLVPTANRP